MKNEIPSELDGVFQDLVHKLQRPVKLEFERIDNKRHYYLVLDDKRLSYPMTYQSMLHYINGFRRGYEYMDSEYLAPLQSAVGKHLSNNKKKLPWEI